MVVKFFRLKVEGSAQRLQQIKTFLETKFDRNDMHSRVGDGVILINSNFLQVDIYLKNNINANKYKTFIQNYIDTGNMNNIDKISVEVYENCTHDEINHQPCQPSKVLTWP